MKSTLNTVCILLVILIFSDGNWPFNLNIINPSAPIEVDRLTVVIVEETENRDSIPSSQLNAISSQVWRDYVEEDGGQWRVLDPHTDISKDKPWVKESLNKERTSLPWLIVSTKNDGYSGPMPNTVDELMGIIKK